MIFKILSTTGQKMDLIVAGETVLRDVMYDEIKIWMKDRVQPWDVVLERDLKDVRGEFETAKSGFQALVSFRWGDKISVWSKKHIISFIPVFAIPTLRSMNFCGTALWWLGREAMHLLRK